MSLAYKWRQRLLPAWLVAVVLGLLGFGALTGVTKSATSTGSA